VGRNLIPYLLQHGDSVTALSRSAKADDIITDAAASADSKVTIMRGSLESDRDMLVRGVHSKELLLRSAVTVCMVCTLWPHRSLRSFAGMTGCDAVIHSAAKVDGWGPWEPFQQTNVDGAKCVIPWLPCFIWLCGMDNCEAWGTSRTAPFHIA
jgi:nucleoside-diphosphate-sugar epimerase